MNAQIVNTDVIYGEAFAAYANRADRRIRSGIRTTLEALGLPLPEAILRTPPGHKPGKAIAAAFAADAAIHGDLTFTRDGNRRLAPDGKLPPSRFNSGQ